MMPNNRAEPVRGKPQFWPIFAHSASTVRAGEKSSISTNRSRQRAFQRAIDEPCMLPLSPPTGGAKRDIAVFPVKFNFGRKKSHTKFLCVKTCSGKVVATSFLYLTVHRRIAGDVPIYQKNCAQSDLPFTKRRFRQISLNSAAAIRTSEKSSTIANRISTMRFPSTHRWTPCVTPKVPKGGSKWEFVHLALPFISSLQVIVDTLNLVCGLNIASPSLQMTNSPEIGVATSHDPL